MFTATIKAEKIAQFISNANALVDEAKVHTNEDGLRLAAVDPANVGMIEQTLDASAFDSYNADGGLIGLETVRTADVLGMADSDDTVRLALDDATRKLDISFAGLDYTLALIVPDSIREEPDLPDLGLDVSAVVEWRQVKQAIKAADMVSDHLRIEADPDVPELVFSAEGDTDDVLLRVDGDDLLNFLGGTANSIISLDYLKDFRSAPGADTETTIHADEEFPVKIEWEFADGDGHSTVMIAPRIQGD